MASNSAVVGMLRVLLGMDTAEFTKATATAARQARDFEKSMLATGRQLTTVGAALTKTLTVPILGLGVATAKAAIDFESSFAGVRKTVNATEAEFAELAQGMRDLSKEIPINVNELNKIGEAAGQLGIKTENILGFTEVMAQLGVTTNLSAEQAATSLARLANITQMPQSEFGRLGSTIVDLGNNFATTEAEIVDFGLRIAGAGQIAGLSEHQILAIGSAMSSVGVQAEAGGTAVQKVLNGMTEAVATGGKELTTFAETAGLSAEQFAAAFRDDAANAFNLFVQGLGRQGDQAFVTLDKLKLGNERVIRAFLSLANAGDLLTRNLDTASNAWEQNTALTEEARKRFETTASQLTLLWNRVKDVGITIGNALLPAIQSTIGLLNALMPVLDGAAKIFAALPGPVQMVGIGLLALVAAAGPALYILGHLALSAAAVAKVFTAKGLVTQALAGNVVGLNTSLGVLGRTVGVVSVAFASWSLTRLIMEFFDLDRAVEKYLFSGQQLALQLQTNLASQDAINLAIERGADKTINATEALAFNTEWLKKRLAALKASADSEQRTGGATAALTDKMGALSAQLKAADAEIAQLSASARSKLVTAIQSGAFSMKELEEASGLSEAALKLFQDRIETTATATEEAADDLKTYREEQEKIAAAVNQAFFAEQVRADQLRMALAKVETATIGLTAGNFRLRDASGKLDAEWKTNLIPGAIEVSGLLADIEQGSTATVQSLTSFGTVIDKVVIPAAQRVRVNLLTAFSQLPNLLVQAFTGGGGLAGALKAFGVQIADAILRPLMAGLQTAARMAVSFGASLSTALSGASGLGPTATSIVGIGTSLAGAALAASAWGTSMAAAGVAGTIALGAATLGIGAAVVGIIALVKWFNNGRDEANAMTAEVLRLNGGFDAMAEKLFIVTGSHDLMAQLMDAKKPREVRAAIDDINAALVRFNDQLRELRGSADATNQRMLQLRDISPELQAALETVYNAQTPQEYADAIGRVNREVDEALRKQSELDQSIADLGIDFKNLPAELRAQKLGQEFQDVKDDVDNVTEAGVSMKDAIKGAGPALSELVQEAQRTGTEIPESLRPILQQAIEHGVLIDKNGKKITDLTAAGVVFGSTYEDNGEKVETAMDLVVKALDRIIARLEALDGKTVETNVIVNQEYRRNETANREPTEGSTNEDTAATGGLVTASGIQRFAMGGIVKPRDPQYFGMGGIAQPRGTDTVHAMLTPGEEVTSVRDRSITHAALDALRAAGGSTTVHIGPFHVDGVFSEGDLQTTIRRRVVPIIAKVIEDNVEGNRTRFREGLGVD
jgi:TP901 family phage tail tape measure protein